MPILLIIIYDWDEIKKIYRYLYTAFITTIWHVQM